MFEAQTGLRTNLLQREALLSEERGMKFFKSAGSISQGLEVVYLLHRTIFTKSGLPQEVNATMPNAPSIIRKGHQTSPTPCVSDEQ